MGLQDRGLIHQCGQGGLQAGIGGGGGKDSQGEAKMVLCRQHEHG